MEKNIIKAKLREGLMAKLTETEPKKAESNDNSSDHGKQFEKDYSSVQNALDGTLLKASQVFSAAGLGSPDDATSRSLNSKKLRREKNPDTGSLYQFDDKELASIIKVVNNPNSYLHNKGK